MKDVHDPKQRGRVTTVDSTFRLHVTNEWAIGPFTKHRLVVGVSVAFFATTIYWLQAWLWPADRVPRSIVEHLWASGQYLWLAGAPVCTLMILGIMLYRREPAQEVSAIPQLVVWRIVTRGQNVQALLATVHAINRSMQETPLFDYLIEVVTESGTLEDVVLPMLATPVQFLHVPVDYRTPQGTRFKARALQYAVEHSAVPDTAWLVHLDEETSPTRSGIVGITRMIQEEEATGKLRIGQGPILYHRQWHQHPFMTLADNSRTGMDFGPFYLQSRLGTSVFGFHGSYIVIRNDVEKATGGFDLGPQGDITEDAWWILIANERGFAIRWVDGYLEEQSTQSIKDFLKQRQRWMEGLIKVVRYAPVPLWRRVPLGLNLLLWMCVCMSVLYSVAHVFYGFDTVPWIRAVANWSWATCATMYIVGLLANLNASGRTGFWVRAKWIALQAFLVPVFCLLEIVGALGGIFRPQNGFHVIKK